MGKWKIYYLFFTLTLIFTTGFSFSAHSAKGHGHGKEQADSMDEFFKGASKQNGYSIYFDGVTLTGEQVPIKGGPHWLTMHGGGCANCHGGKGQGGFQPMMCAKKTPPIDLKTLLSGSHKHAGEEDHHTPYTVETIKRALEFSINPDSKPFGPCMPKWILNDKDFRDLLFYMSSFNE